MVENGDSLGGAFSYKRRSEKKGCKLVVSQYNESHMESLATSFPVFSYSRRVWDVLFWETHRVRNAALRPQVKSRKDELVAHSDGGLRIWFRPRLSRAVGIEYVMPLVSTLLIWASTSYILSHWRLFSLTSRMRQTCPIPVVLT